MKTLTKLLTTTAIAAATLATPVMAKDLKIVGDVKAITIQTADGPFEIKRKKTEAGMITGVLQPFTAAEGVETIGELEVLDALQNPSEWVILDHRAANHYRNGHLPNAISVPFKVAEGVAAEYAGKQIVSYCYGANCPTAIRGINSLIKGGIPAENIHYYRGGVVAWSALGLPIFE